MPVLNEVRPWKVTFKDATTNAVDIVYPKAVTRRDAIDLATEYTKLNVAACTVTATTQFDHKEMEVLPEEMSEKVVIDRDDFYAGIAAVDKDKLPCSPEEAAEDPLEKLRKSSSYGKDLPQNVFPPAAHVPEEEKLEIVLDSTPEEDRAYYEQEIAKLEKIMVALNVEDRITNAILDYFLRNFLPNMSFVQLLEMFQNTPVSFGEVRNFLEKHMKEGHVEIIL